MRTMKRTDAPLRAARASLIVLLVPVLHGLPAHAAEPAGAEGLRFFREKIEPVLGVGVLPVPLVARGEGEGGTAARLARRDAPGGDTGPAVVPGEVDESLLILAIRHEDGLAMPPKKPKLPDAAIADFATWVEMGAPAPAEEEASAPRSRERDEARRHWAFQPVARVAPPKVEDAAWVKSPVDAFVLAKLEGRGWRPAPPAGRAEWIRRVTFDLTGLPRHPRRSRRSRRTRRPMPMSGWSTGSWAARDTASAGRSTGSTWSGTPRPRVTSTTTPCPTPGGSATM